MSATANGVGKAPAKRKPSEIESLLYGDEDEGHLYYLGKGTVTAPLLGTWEVARYLGIERSRIARWLDENTRGKQAIEPPVCRLKSGPMWTLDQIKRKARQMYLADPQAVTAAPSMVDQNIEAWLESRRAKRV